MKTIAIATFLSAGIAGAYAQTNNNGGTGTPTNPPDKSISPNNGGTNNKDGSNNNNTVTSPNKGGSNKNNTITPKDNSKSIPKATTTAPKRDVAPNTTPTEIKPIY